ncbi:MAG: ABC transporter permease subunit [Patescibacteria group bacterium]|nr:ABC transporter permease subunit [Patescibacteria group bacterium]
MGKLLDLASNCQWGNILLDCFYSLERVIIGVLAAIIIGIAVGLFRSSLPTKLQNNCLIKFLFEAPKFPPPIAWIPFVILFFGIGDLSAYVIVFIGAFSPIFISAYDGARSVPLIIKNTAYSMEVSKWKFLILVILPASLPKIFTGIRAGISMGWMSVIAAEMISGQSGLGYSIQLNRLNLQYNSIILDIILIGLIGYLLFESAGYLEKKIIPWHIKTRNAFL